MASVTETLPPRSEPTLMLPLEPGLDMRIDLLLRLLSDCKQWSPETREKVISWEKSFSEKFRPHLQTKEGARIATRALCYLLINIVRPEIRELTGHRAEQKELASCEVAAREILKILLPKGDDCGRFIADFGRSELARKIEELRVTVRIEALQRLSGCQTEKFEAMKAQLLELNTNKMNMKAELRARVELATNGLLTLCNSLKKLSDEVSQSAEVLLQYEAQFQGLMQECERLCHQVQKL